MVVPCFLIAIASLIQHLYRSLSLPMIIAQSHWLGQGYDHRQGELFKELQNGIEILVGQAVLKL